MELVMELEASLGVDIPDHGVEALWPSGTARDLSRLVVLARTEIAPPRVPDVDDANWALVRRCIAHVERVEAEEVSPGRPLFGP